MSTYNVTGGDAAGFRAVVETLAAAGDKVIAGSGTYVFTAPVTISKGITIEGEAPGAVTLSWSTATHGLAISNASASISRLAVRNLRVIGSGGSTLDGMSFVGTQGNGLSHFMVDACDFSGWRNGLSIDNSNTDPSGNGSIGTQFVFYDLDVSASRTRGIVLKGLSVCEIEDCEVNSSGLNGIWCNACSNLAIRKTASEGNNTSHDSAAEGAAQVLVKLCHGFVIDNLDVESMPTAIGAVKTGLAVSRCFGGSITGFHIAQTGTTFYPDSIGVNLMLGTRGLSKIELIHNYITTPVGVDKQSIMPPGSSIFSTQQQPYAEATAGLFNP